VPEHPGEQLGTIALIPKDASADVVRFSGPDSGSAEITIEFDGRPIEVVGTHPPSLISSSDEQARDDQLSATWEWAAGQEVPVVVVGDSMHRPGPTDSLS